MPYSVADSAQTYMYIGYSSASQTKAC